MATEHEKLVAAVKEALKSERDQFWVDQPQHYMDHKMLEQCRSRHEEWRANHEFISSVRTGAAWGGKAGIGAIVIATITFVGGAIFIAIKAALSKP